MRTDEVAEWILGRQFRKEAGQVSFFSFAKKQLSIHCQIFAIALKYFTAPARGRRRI
jgi:hypothetical protein